MNVDLFDTAPITRETDTTNEAGGEAYAFSPKHALAQYAMTGTFSDAAYCKAEDQLTTLLNIVAGVEADFTAKTAIYAREKGHMKDTPAVLLAFLTGMTAIGPEEGRVQANDLLKKAFPRVIDNGRMVRNYAQAVRSGAAGRRSFGNAPKRLIQNFLRGRSPEQLLRDSVGSKPSLRDVLRMVHPRAKTPAQNSMFGFICGKEFSMEPLPERVRNYIRWKNGDASVSFEDVAWAPFELLTSKKLSTSDWADIIRTAGWHMTRMNLNTAMRHDVFEQHPELIEIVANRLCDREAIQKARVFPYQLFTAYKHVNDDVPASIKDALEQAVQISLDSIPEIEGNVAVLPDVSGSMNSPVTGYRSGGTSAMRCVDVAALVASAFNVKMGNRCTVIPFDTKAHDVVLTSESVLANAAELSKFGGGGTNCACALARLNETDHVGNLVVFVSDNESWVKPEGEDRYSWYNSSGTSVMQEWNTYKMRNPDARLVCIDIQPYGSTQAHDREDILNIGGFSDSVFETIAKFTAGESVAVSDEAQSVERFVAEIDAVEL